MSIATENDLIERLAECIRFFGCERDDAGEHDEQLQYAYGHSGDGWYLSCGQYPDEGAEFIAPEEYGALVVAQAIVAAERGAAGAVGNPEPQRLPTDAPVTFEAQLMSAGNAEHLAEDLAAQGSTPVLIFHAEVEEVRKTAPLFHKMVRLTTAPDVVTELIEARAGLAWYRTEYPEADGRGDDEVLARIDAAIARASR